MDVAVRNTAAVLPYHTAHKLFQQVQYIIYTHIFLLGSYGGRPVVPSTES